MTVTWGGISASGADGQTSAVGNIPGSLSGTTSWLYAAVVSGGATEPTPTPPAGWSTIGTFSGGSGATYAADVGNRRVTIFKKDTMTGSESGSITATLADGDTCKCRVFSVSKTSGWLIAEDLTFGEDTTNGTSWSATGDAVNWAVDDLLIVITAQNNDAASQSSQGISASGITFGTRSNKISQAGTEGNDVRLVIDTHSITAGSGSAAPTWTHTNSANADGVTAFLRLRDFDPAAVVTPAMMMMGVG
jgi:hypothetical protein